jgi:DNA invertase Pin-like site-specific DNA recombinase
MTSNDQAPRAAIYAHVQRAALPNSLKAQVDACHAYAAGQSIKVVETYVEEGSANSPPRLRPALLSLLSALEKHEIDIVLVDDMARLSRNAITLMTPVILLGVRVHTVSEGQLNPFSLLVHVLMAAQRHEQRRRLARRSHKEARA